MASSNLSSFLNLTDSMDDAQFAKQIQSVTGTKNIKTASIEDLDAALATETLDVLARPLSYLLILEQKTIRCKDKLCLQHENFQTDSSRYLHQVARLLTYAPIAVTCEESRAFDQVTSIYMQHATYTNQIEKILYPIRTFLLRRYKENQNLIPLHGQFLYHCIATKHYAFARDILKLQITQIDKDVKKFISLDYIRYVYYSGVIHQSQKDYKSARNAFLLAITAPAVSLSEYAVEAYKKYMLVSLIENGDVSPLPGYTPYIVLRQIHHFCDEYTKLVEAFEHLDWIKMDQLITSSENVFKQDGNFGLVKQCTCAMRRYCFQKVTKTYSCLSILNFASKANLGTNLPLSSLEEVEKFVLEAGDKQWQAVKVDQLNNLLYFNQYECDESTEAYHVMYSDMLMQIDQLSHQMYAIAKEMQKTDGDIVLHYKFISQLQRNRDRAEHTPTDRRSRFEDESSSTG